jgi:A/G-specific adenine glycosylase
MLQQTQVDTVIPFYDRFLKVFPSVDTLARASLEEVLKVWENMGYYARARHLHAAARLIMDRFGGRFPNTKTDMLSLPGIGSYTAGAILSIAFGQPAAAPDSNIMRVLSRLYALQEPVNTHYFRETLVTLAENMVPKKKPGDFNQALMDLGAPLCRPKNPYCKRCRLDDLCLARLQGIENNVPMMLKKRPLPHRNATAAVLRKGKKVLFVQRPSKGLLGGLWAFPGGFTEPEETLQASLVRHVLKGVGLTIDVGKELASVDHAYTHFRVTTHAFICRPVNGAGPVQGVDRWRWLDAGEIREVAFSKMDRRILELIL